MSAQSILEVLPSDKRQKLVEMMDDYIALRKSGHWVCARQECGRIYKLVDGLTEHRHNGQEFCSAACADAVRRKERELFGVKYKGARFEDVGAPPRLFNCRWVDWVLAAVDKVNEFSGGAYIYGPVGCGKSVALAVMAQKVFDAVGQVKRVRWMSAPAMAEEMRGGVKTGVDVLKPMLKADFLFIDEFGAGHITDFVRDKFLRLVVERHEYMRPTFFSSNFELEELEQVIGERISSRIVEMVGGGQGIFSFEGKPDLRIRRM